MKKTTIIVVLSIIIFTLSCVVGNNGNNNDYPAIPDDGDIVFLHHSTGGNVWNGGVLAWFTAYNTAHSTDYAIVHKAFPTSDGYGWKNYPYDYWKIWVDKSDTTGELVLEQLTKVYDVIIWKHCYPVSDIQPDTGTGDVASETKRLENYKLQYAALKQEMLKYPDNRFIVWTGAALVASATTADEAARARAFAEWVKNTWDTAGDNIYIWDFFELETEGGNYNANAVAPNDSHPNAAFCTEVAPYFCQRIIDVIDGNGDTGSITGN